MEVVAASCPFVVESFLQQAILFVSFTLTKSYQEPYDMPAACASAASVVAFEAAVEALPDASASVA